MLLIALMNFKYIRGIIMIKVERYRECKEDEWNDFNMQSKNSLFMFDRKYMDYHKDRFRDHSLMFYDEDELVAILPMTEKDNIFVSHGGLTYGGIISGKKMKQHTMNECIFQMIQYAKINGINKIYYKNIPHIYHEQPAEEDIYALFLNNASLVRVESSTVINLKQPLKMPKGRKAQISRAKRERVEIMEVSDEKSFYNFIDLENSVLSEHHDTSAVHTGAELFLLKTRFPNQIHLYVAYKDGEMIAGTVVFEYNRVIHTQYMAANDLARQIGALDLAVSSVIDKFKNDKDWLDFGISTESGGRVLNEGLISQKEGFGGRTNVYQMWQIEVNSNGVADE